MSWERYHSIDDFYTYFGYLEQNYKDLFFTEIIGKSYESKFLKYLFRLIISLKITRKTEKLQR